METLLERGCVVGECVWWVRKRVVEGGRWEAFECVGREPARGKSQWRSCSA